MVKELEVLVDWGDVGYDDFALIGGVSKEFIWTSIKISSRVSAFLLVYVSMNDHEIFLEVNFSFLQVLFENNCVTSCIDCNTSGLIWYILMIFFNKEW